MSKNTKISSYGAHSSFSRSQTYRTTKNIKNNKPKKISTYDIPLGIIDFIIGVIAIAALLGVAICGIKYISHLNEKELTWIEYKVKAGDTLWKLAPKDCGRSKPELVSMIEERNGITAEIFPGDIIEIPVVVEK